MKKNVFIIALIAASIAPLKAQNHTSNQKNYFIINTVSKSTSGFQKSTTQALSKSTILNNPSSQTIDNNRNAGNHLILAGKYMTYASLSTVVSTVFIYAGDPVTGLLISVAAVVLEFSAYNQLQKAGTELKKQTN